MKFRILLAALALSMGVFAQKKAWSLQDCLIYAFENNLSVRQSQLNIQSSGINIDGANARLLPTLNLNGGYFWQFGFNIDPISNIRVPGNRQTSSYTLSSNWILFDGMQNYKRISQARLDNMAALYNLDAIRNDIGLNIASAYLQVLLNKQVMEVAENQLRISENLLKRSEKLYQNGSVPRGDFLQSQAQQAQDEQSMVAARNNHDISLLQLAQLLQLDDYTGFDIEIPQLSDPGNALLSYSPQQIYQVALSNQPDIKGAELSMESAAKGIEIAKGAYSPTLSLQAQVNSNAAGDFVRATSVTDPMFVPVGTLTPGGNDYIWSLTQRSVPLGTENYPFFEQFRDNINQFVGIGVQIPIFNQLQIRNNVASSRLQYERAQLDLETRKNNLRQTIERAYADANASLRSYTAAKRSLEAATESWEYAQKRYEQGAINFFDYEITRSQFLNSTAQMLQSKYDFIFKMKVLEFYLTNNITLD